MTRAYIRKDPGFFERKAINQAYPAGAYVALDGVFCLAESQPERGRFRDRRLLRALLGPYGKWVTFLLERRDIIELVDGRIYVEGWDEWQEGDWKVGERVQRIRSRKAPSTVTDVTPDTVTSTVTPRRARESRTAIATSSLPEGVQGEPHDDRFDAPELRAFIWLQEHRCLLRQGDGYHQRLIHAVERHGVDALIAQFERLAQAGFQNGDLKGFLFGAIDALDKATRPDVEADERAADQRRSWESRVEATRRRNRELHPELYEEAAS